MPNAKKGMEVANINVELRSLRVKNLKKHDNRIFKY